VVARQTVYVGAAIVGLSTAATTAVAGGFADQPTPAQVAFMVTTGLLTAVGLTLGELANKSQTATKKLERPAVVRTRMGLSAIVGRLIADFITMADLQKKDFEYNLLGANRGLNGMAAVCVTP
jgi:hypothetical protein